MKDVPCDLKYFFEPKGAAVVGASAQAIGAGRGGTGESFPCQTSFETR